MIAEQKDNMKYSLDVPVCDGKYRVVFDEKSLLLALRYDEPWRKLSGDNLVYWLAVELDEARKKLKELKCQSKN